MSLMQGLLQEPPLMEVHIALRPDGAYGSGRADDPYSGGTLDNPQIPLLSLTRTGLVATATTTTPHGYVTGQHVQVAGVSGIASTSGPVLNASAYYNGIFTITVTGATTFTYALAADPGGTAVGAPFCKRDSGLVISSLTYAGGVATAVASSAHGFKTGDLVQIAGVRSVSSGTNRYWQYNGTFAVTPDGVDPTKFTYAPHTDPGGPAVSSPGVITCRLDPYLFDRVMRSLQGAGPVKVCLGPGVFETKGFCESVAASWQPSDGMNLVGSGMRLTTLKLVGAALGGDDPSASANPSNPRPIYQAIGVSSSRIVNYVSVSDLTVDANVGGQLSLSLACGGIVIYGSHTRLRRVRAINFGTRTLDQECFVLAIAGATQASEAAGGITDCVAEECLIEQPTPGNVRETTTILLVSVGGTDGLMAIHTACAIRDCTINCEFQENPLSIASKNWPLNTHASPFIGDS